MQGGLGQDVAGTRMRQTRSTAALSRHARACRGHDGRQAGPGPEFKLPSKQPCAQLIFAIAQAVGNTSPEPRCEFDKASRRSNSQHARHGDIAEHQIPLRIAAKPSWPTFLAKARHVVRATAKNFGAGQKDGRDRTSGPRPSSSCPALQRDRTLVQFVSSAVKALACDRQPFPAGKRPRYAACW
jgi:hypothetical protein